MQTHTYSVLGLGSVAGAALWNRFVSQVGLVGLVGLVSVVGLVGLVGLDESLRYICHDYSECNG